MRTSPVSVSLGVFLFILLPTFSSSSCFSTLKCSNTNTDPIEIRPPFFVATPGLDPACEKSVSVSCGQLGPELDLATSESKLLLNGINYDSHTVLVQDVQLSVLKNLSCSFTFTFRPPVANFQSSYPHLVTWFSSISCGHTNLTAFPSIFGDGKNVDQSTEPDERGFASCHGSPQFEWILNFSGNGKAGQMPQFSVLSGSIRKYLLSSSDCVSPSPGGNNMIIFLHAELTSVHILYYYIVSNTLVTLDMKSKIWKFPQNSNSLIKSTHVLAADGGHGKRYGTRLLMAGKNFTRNSRRSSTVVFRKTNY
jgi:hypothetical protein